MDIRKCKFCNTFFFIWWAITALLFNDIVYLLKNIRTPFRWWGDFNSFCKLFSLVVNFSLTLWILNFTSIGCVWVSWSNHPTRWGLLMFLSISSFGKPVFWRISRTDIFIFSRVSSLGFRIPNKITQDFL